MTMKTDYNEKYKPTYQIHIVKKDGTKEPFQVQKVVNAVGKSAERVMVILTAEEKGKICKLVIDKVEQEQMTEIPIAVMHHVVEYALEQINQAVAKSYRDYRNYKQDFVQMLDEVYKKSQAIMYIGDKENANASGSGEITIRDLIKSSLRMRPERIVVGEVRGGRDCL